MKILSQIKGVEILRAQEGHETRLVQRMTCGQCGQSVDFINAKGAAYPEQALFRFARQKGWEPSRKGRHVCPNCMESKPLSDFEAPREMTPKERRQIFREIDDHYEEAQSRYVDNVTDDTIARALGVPRKWVSDIREENFGPSGENGEMQRVAALIGRLSAELTGAINEAMEAAAKAEKLKAEVDQCREDLDRIKKAVGPYRAA